MYDTCCLQFFSINQRHMEPFTVKVSNQMNLTGNYRYKVMFLRYTHKFSNKNLYCVWVCDKFNLSKLIIVCEYKSLRVSMKNGLTILSNKKRGKAMKLMKLVDGQTCSHRNDFPF